MEKLILERICKRIDTYEKEAINLERELTAIPALAPENDGDGEQKKSEFLQTYLERELKCEVFNRYNAPDDRVSAGHRPNMIGNFKGKDSGKTLWIMSHMDVVPPGDLSKWKSDPWSVKVEDGKIYGRGTEDNQQGIVSSLLAVKAFRDEGLDPEINIGLILVSDEETGNDYGICYLLKNHQELFKKEDLFIVPDSGNSEGTVIEVAEKSILWFKFRVEGKQTHASTPDLGVNAHTAGAHLIMKLQTLYSIYAEEDPIFDPPKSTFEPTKREANVPNVNTIPGDDVFFLDCRVLPKHSLEEVKRQVYGFCKEIEMAHKVSIEVTIPLELKAPPPTSIKAPVVKSIARAILEIKGVEAEPQGIGGGTVAAYFREAGFAAVVWATQDETLHEPNEYVRIENILSDAKVFAHLALQTE